ncbi:hypothetical protein [Hymenobacter saemangeumensis]
MLGFLRLAYYKRYKPEVLSTAYHEAGHGIVAALFAQELELVKLTVNRKALKRENRAYNGALHVSFFTKPLDTDFEAGDHLTLIALAGTCSRTLYTRGQEAVYDGITNMTFYVNRDAMDRTGAHEDWSIASLQSTRTQGYINAPKDVILNSGVRWVFNYLMQPDVWRATERLAEEIIRRPGLTLSNNQISRFLNKIGFTSYLAQHSKGLLSMRYPLSVNSLVL